MLITDAIVHTGSSCRLCRKGNASNPDAHLPFFSPDASEEDGNVLTCGEYENSMSLWDESISCDLSAHFLGNYCQCDGRSTPVKEPKCSLCGVSEVPEHNIFANQLYHFQPDKAINITRFPFSTCQKLAQAAEMLLTESSEDCKVLRLRFADYCGCENTRIDDPCSLCTDRSPVTKPSRQIKFLRDDYFGLDPTCEIYASSVRSVESYSKECKEAQKLGSYCGCPARENACRFCEVGEITKPDKELKILENKFGYAPTCDQLEAILQQSSANSHICGFSQEMDYLCGCRNGLYGYHGTENEREQYILALLPRVAGSISVFGSFFIMVDSAYIKRSPTIYHVLMFFMAFFDLITSVCWIIGSKAVPPRDQYGEDFPAYGVAHGNDATCKIQGTLIQLGFGSIFYHMALNTFYVLTVVYGWSESKLKKIKIYLYVVPGICSLTLALAGIPFYGSLSIGCYILPYPYESTNLYVICFATIWILIGTVYSTAAMVKIFLAVQRNELKSKRWRAERVNQRRERRSRQVLYQGMFYLVNFYLSWPTLAIGMLIAGYQNFEFWAFFLFLCPLQGFTNFLVYIRPRVLRAKAKRKKRTQSASGIQFSSFLWSSLSRSQYRTSSTMDMDTSNDVDVYF